MAREPNANDFAADYEALVAQMAAMRDEMGKLASQMTASAAAHGVTIADTLVASVHDAQKLAGRKAHEADLRLGAAVSANPYLALGIAAGFGLLLGAVTRR